MCECVSVCMTVWTYTLERAHNGDTIISEPKTLRTHKRRAASVSQNLMRRAINKSPGGQR